MITFLKSQLDKILLGLAALGAIFFAFLKGKASQRQKTQAKTTKTILKTTEKVRENAEKVRDPSRPDNAIDRLRKNHSRD